MGNVTTTYPDGVRVLIVEPHANGHHGPYLEWMAKGLVARGFRLAIVTLSDSMKHPSMIALARTAETGPQDTVQFIVDDRPIASHNTMYGLGGLVARETAYWRRFRIWYEAHGVRIRPDVVFLPYLDYCLYATGLLGSPFNDCPWVGLAMRPSFHYRQMGVIAPRPSLAIVKKMLFFRLLRNPHLRCVLTIDEPLCEYLAANPALARKIAFLPEASQPTDPPDPTEAKRQLGIPSEHRLILVYGAITPRKGVLELLRALAHPSFPLSVDILLAGMVSSEIHQVLSSPDMMELVARGRVNVLDRFIESNEEPVLFAAADIVWLGYRGHYTPSGVLAQAASAGRSVLACHEGVIGWQTRRHNLGQVVDPGDLMALIAAVRALLDTNKTWAAERRAGGTALGWSPSSAVDVLERALTRDVSASR